MTQTQSRLERLDIAARAMVAEHAFAVERLSWTAIAGLVVFLAVRSTAPAPGTLGLRINAAVCAIIALLFWLNWRYAFHALALGWAAGGFAMFWFYIPHPHTIIAWTLRCILPLVCMRMVYRELKLGIPYAEARGRGWEAERSQVHEWFKLLMNQNSSSSTVEVPSRSFWSGLSTYRLVYLGDCWAIARFKTGNHSHLLGFRVFARGAVCAAQGLDGKLALYFGSEKIRQASLTPEMLHSLLQLAKPADSAP